jgi:ABC-type multidrug transport system, ATPase and permease components
MKNIFEKTEEFIKIVKFCFKISWKASSKYLSIRILLELVAVGIPSVTIILSKVLIDFFAVLPRMKSDISNQIDQLILILVLMIILSIVNRIVNKVKDYYSILHKDLISREIEIQIAEKSASLDLSYFDSSKFYDEMSNAKRDSNALQTLTWFVMDVIRSGVQLIISFIIIFKLNAIFAILLIATGIPPIFAEKKYTEFIYNWQRKHMPEERKMNYILSIFTGGIFVKDVRLFGIQNEYFSKYNLMWNKWFKEKKENTFKRSRNVILQSILPEIGSAGILLYVGIEIIHGRLTVGDYSLYSGMIGQLITALFMIVLLISKIYDNNLRLLNYNNFIQWESKIMDTGNKIPVLPIEIQFVDVSFKYPGTEQYILKNVNFSISQNEKVALVGLNGAGKSTIIKLILRYYDTTEGRILVNGTDIKEYNLKEYRRHFSVMFQDYAGYAFSIKDNITISDLDNKEDNNKLKNAVNKSGAQFVADRFITGLDTYLTRQFEEEGKELSGGEWQKIALARTFFREGDIIILDEPSATLDPEAENQIFEKLAELCKDKGAIFISHRLSNVTIADRIIVLANGEIIEDGSHSELMSLKGKYAYLFNLQAEKYKVG